MISYLNTMNFNLRIKTKWSALLPNYCTMMFAYLSFCAAALNLKETFESNKIVPDIIPNTPDALLKASFPDADFTIGDSLTAEQTKQPPRLGWTDENTYYTVIMTDPDCPSPANPTLKELEHWIVGNIYRKNITSGNTIVEYTGPRDREEYVVEQGKHRYIISVFEQIGRLLFAERRIENDNMLLRGQFSTKSFVSEYRLRGPIAATFFYVDHPTNSSSAQQNV